MANGCLSDDVDAAWAKLTDQTVLLKLGLLHVDKPGEATMQEHSELCKLSLDALRNLSRQFGMWEMEFTFGLPFQFFRLISVDPLEVASVTLLGFIIVLRLLTFIF